MKICRKCNIEKEKEFFSKDASSKDGLKRLCKLCISLWNKNHRLNNKDKAILRDKKYRGKNPEKIRAASRRWREKNKQRKLEVGRAYQERNREKINQYSREWSRNNKELKLAYSRNRRAISKKADGTHTPDDVANIFNLQRGMCANCGCKLFKSGKKKMHVDHIMPLALGGSNWPSNLQCLCPTCNLRKSSKHPDDWANQQGRLL
jgi:5-methylcytosine-specific restriction endonuclease McrA